MADGPAAVRVAAFDASNAWRTSFRITTEGDRMPTTSVALAASPETSATAPISLPATPTTFIASSTDGASWITLRLPPGQSLLRLEMVDTEILRAAAPPALLLPDAWLGATPTTLPALPAARLLAAPAPGGIVTLQLDASSPLGRLALHTTYPDATLVTSTAPALTGASPITVTPDEKDNTFTLTRLSLAAGQSRLVTLSRTPEQTAEFVAEFVPLTGTVAPDTRILLRRAGRDTEADDYNPGDNRLQWIDPGDLPADTTALLELQSVERFEGYIRLKRTPAFDGFKIGDRVILGRHEDLPGHGRNWAEDMAQYVGRPATITELRGQEDDLLWLVRVDVDQGSYVWRTRNLTRAR